MPLQWVPVNPDAHTAASANEAHKVTSIGERSGQPPFTDAVISSFTLSLKGMLSLGFGGMAEFEGKTGVYFFVLEVAAYTDTVLVTDVTDVELRLERLGVGFRIGVATWGASFRATANLSAVAASVQMKWSSTKLAVELAGKPALDQLPFIQPLLARTNFNPDYLQAVSGAAAGLTDYLASTPEVEPVTLQIAPLNLPRHSLEVAAYSAHLALQQILWRSPAVLALGYAADTPERMKLTDAIIVRSTYRELGIENDYQVPNDQQVEEAWRLLMLGRF